MIQFNFNDIEELVQTGDGNAFYETIGATLFGFILAEGWSYCKERQRLKRVGSDFIAEFSNLLDTLQKQIDTIDEYLPLISEEKIEFPKNVFKGSIQLNSSNILSISQYDISKYISTSNSKNKNFEALKRIKTIFVNIEVVKVQFQTMQNDIGRFFNEGGISVKIFQNSLSSLVRQSNSLFTEEKRKKQNISGDAFLSSLNVIINSPNVNLKYTDHTKIYTEIIDPIIVFVSQFRTDSRGDQLKGSLYSTIDEYKSLKSLFRNFRASLELSKSVFEKSLENLKQEFRFINSDTKV